MNRRELIKSIPALAAIPFAWVGDKPLPDGVKAIPLEEHKTYLFLINPYSIDVDSFCESLAGTNVCGPVIVVKDAGLDEAIRIFKLED